MELQDEHRLCYIGMTRTKIHLIMMSHKEATVFTGMGMKVNKENEVVFSMRWCLKITQE